MSGRRCLSRYAYSPPWPLGSFRRFSAPWVVTIATRSLHPSIGEFRAFFDVDLVLADRSFPKFGVQVPVVSAAETDGRGGAERATFRPAGRHGPRPGGLRLRRRGESPAGRKAVFPAISGGGDRGRTGLRGPAYPDGAGRKARVYVSGLLVRRLDLDQGALLYLSESVRNRVAGRRRWNTARSMHWTAPQLLAPRAKVSGASWSVSFRSRVSGGSRPTRWNAG